MKQITFAELPETVQNLINQAQKTGEPFTIIQNGIAIAIISPINKSKRVAFGSMKDSGQITGDIVEPTSNLVTWDVLL
ncbi:type II toxin-antitoxin system Phd/YefM family antitoxin [Nostoc sp. TCL26-01]|uniref:type II toxin-antitoxin system Phd/YefM family antitoxin n=1 Tax=Nostoc sp. TCL26-01 TaxID=2576904 RepID=UPI0015BD4159|nr:type II toxin-antitoxin system Phd/YefM family antitoxin [Nostoc sp. TCL26-01]QLE58257.1 type II toxin-antitoxin system Phd/YefM family antitoxin [Nostoc sp. TCL26-01]